MASTGAGTDAANCPARLSYVAALGLALSAGAANPSSDWQVIEHPAGFPVAQVMGLGLAKSPGMTCERKVPVLLMDMSAGPVAGRG